MVYRTQTPGPVPPPPPQPSDQGINVDVTPATSAPQPMPSFKEMPMGPDTSHRSRLMIIGLAVVIIAALFAIIYFYVLPSITTTTTSTSSSTTTVTVSSGYLSGCATIGKPGAYMLKKNISYAVTSGACLNVTSSDVSLSCNGYSIVGSGPYTGVGPFSYGIITANTTNVSVSGCLISNFSYGVYSRSTEDLRLSNNNLTTNYVSDLYLGASNSMIQNNHIAYSSSPVGAVVFANGSTNNRFLNNTLKYNTLIGISLSASHENFSNNYIVGSKASFVCSAGNGYPESSVAKANVCYNQTGCDFVSCIGINIPSNVSQVTLTSSINTCGSIRSPGTYSLTGNLNMLEFSNVSSSVAAQYAIPCLNIAASNVRLNCNNYKIYNAYIGIKVVGQNVSLSDCNVTSSTIGVLLSMSNGSKLSQSLFSKNNVSIQINNSTADILNNVVANNGTYGLLMKGTTASIVQNFTLDNNRFGIFVNGSIGNIFSHGQALSNTRFDVFGTPGATNASTNIMSSTSCNVTDALWAPCKTYVSNTAKYFPLNACTIIKKSGLYNLTSEILGAGNNCMSIQANDVVLDCASLNITGSPGLAGPAISVNGRDNVTVDDCGIKTFNTAVLVSNSTNVTVGNITSSGIAQVGIMYRNERGGSVAYTTTQGTANYSIYLADTKDVLLLNNSGYSVVGHSYAIALYNSTQDIILNNSGSADYVGLGLLGNSANNTVSGNLYTDSAYFDYYCDQQDSAMQVENGGINVGVTTNQCHWLAALPPGSAPLGCTAALATSLFDLKQSYSYGTGTTCFSIRANDTTVNCGGHTILATDGGTFVDFVNAQSGKVENCYLKGFTNPIVAFNSTISVINDTVYNNLTSAVALGSYVVNVSYSPYFTAQQDSFYTPYGGFYIYNVTGGKLTNNNVTASTAYSLYRSYGFEFVSNLAQPGSGVGMYVSNSTQNAFQNNNFQGSTGLLCVGSSKGSTSDVDQSQNTCSSNIGCSWIKGSVQTC